MVVRHLTEGQEIDGVLLVRGRSLRRRPDGSAYLLLSLGDRTGTVAGVLEGDAECCSTGAAVHITGRYEIDARYGPQIAVGAVAPADEIDHDALLDGPPRAAAQMACT